MNGIISRKGLERQSVVNCGRTKRSSKRSVETLGMLLVLSAIVSACGSGSSSDEEVEPTIISVLPSLRGLLPEVNQADATFESLHYSGNGVCAACHTDLATGDAATMVVQDELGNSRDVSIGRAWETSLMANSTRDPYWHAVVASELHKYPNLSEEINDTCTRCHAPMANDFAKKEGVPLQVFDSGSVETGDFVQGIYSMDNTNELFNHAMDGVSCSLCHQIADDGNLGTAEGMSGGWTVNAYPEENIADRPAYGQYTDPDQGYMRAQSNYTPVYGAHMSSSETCGSCHNLVTEPVGKDGLPVPGVSHFAEQMVYTEWENSIFDDAGSQPTSCQDCHMPTLDQNVPLAGGGSDSPRPDFAEHTFLGANTIMQEMLKNFRTELGVSTEISDAAFDESIARNRQFLQTSAILELENTALVDSLLSTDVKVTNLTGHKLPSGYHSRRVFLNVIVTDATGKVVYNNGQIQPNGSIAGVSEDTSPNSYEPHYDKITSETQVQVYQAITGDANGDQTHSLLAATQFLKDNRLTPPGFNKNNVPDDIAVQGAAVTDNDFNNGSDTVTYEMELTGTPPYRVRASLRYQPMSFGSLMALFAESEEVDQVDMFRTIYDSTLYFDEVIATASASVQ